MPDGWEVLYSLNPLDSADATTDPDDDGFTNLQEYQKGTNPINSLSHPPMANAGRDQNVKTGSTVTLDGSASSGQDGNKAQKAQKGLDTPFITCYSYIRLIESDTIMAGHRFRDREGALIC